MSLESAVNLGRRCLQDFYRPRYFILENVRNFVSRRRRWWVHDVGGLQHKHKTEDWGFESPDIKRRAWHA